MALALLPCHALANVPCRNERPAFLNLQWQIAQAVYWYCR
jgi:hypothetical protein